MVATVNFAASAAAFFSTVMAQQFVMYTPGGDDTAVERVDPILYPGVISQHVHQVFGNGAMSPFSNYDNLQDTDCTTVADASNNGNADDNSVYWHPALFMEAKDGSGYIRVPTNGHKLYYKNAGSEQDTKADPFEFPKGFRMLAGNPFIRTPPSDLQQQNITQWICHDTSGSNQGTYGGFPEGVNDCASVDGFNGALHFPHCWNGDDFDLANPTAHVVYPNGDIQNGKCPSSHPTRLPHIFLENTFDIHKVVDDVKPNTFVLAQGDNTGLGWHADFLNGWVSGAIPSLFDSCPQGKYGNEDIGSCGTFHKRSVKASNCQLNITFKEEVTNPGKYLPGCNPISDLNPAPLRAVVPLGISTNVCNIAQGLVPSAEASAPVDNAAATMASSASSAQAAPSTSAAMSSTSSSSAVSTTTSAASSSSVSVVDAQASSSSVAPSASASASASAVANSYNSNTINCPSDNGTLFTAANGKVFEVECGVDHVAGNLDMLYAKSLAACVAACAAHDNCVDVSMSGAACYLKKSLGAAVGKSYINGAKLATSVSASATVVETKVNIIATSTSVAPGGDYDVVWITEIVTVTAVPTPLAVREAEAQPHAHHAHAHAKYHVGRRAF